MAAEGDLTLGGKGDEQNAIYTIYYEIVYLKPI